MSNQACLALSSHVGMHALLDFQEHTPPASRPRPTRWQASAHLCVPLRLRGHPLPWTPVPTLGRSRTAPPPGPPPRLHAPASIPCGAVHGKDDH